MIRHIVAWNFKDSFTDQENHQNAVKIKDMIESLKTCIDGILELKVYIDLMESSNRNVVLNSLFKDEESLSQYQIHPEHKKVAAFIATAMEQRVCIDYKE